MGILCIYAYDTLLRGEKIDCDKLKRRACKCKMKDAILLNTQTAEIASKKLSHFYFREQSNRKKDNGFT